MNTFGPIRSFFWPIHRHEHKKLVPMFVLFFLIAFVYNVLRCMKITLVVTAKGSGAEVIPFLKVWAVLPGALLMAYLYTKLARRLNREQVFYAMISIFLGFFTFFLLVLHPNSEALELTALSDSLKNILPKGLYGLVTLIRCWHLSLFYVLSELWSAIVLSMLFWGFANEVTSVDEAKRFYAIFALGANSSGIFSGQFAQYLSFTKFHPELPFGHNAWDQSLILQLGIVLCMGLVIIALFRYMNKCVLATENINFNTGSEISLSNATVSKTKEPEVKLSLMECFSYLAKSRYMVFITILVVAYNLVYNMSDVLWTEQVKLRFPEASEFNAYINKVVSITGIFATISALFLSGNVIRRYGWTATALITPLIWLVTSFGVFGCLLFANHQNFSDWVFALMGIPVYNLALLIGSAQICLGRAAKYTVFDESKEIAFIPLPKEAQRKGKAVVDGIASRFGKSGGSLVIQFLLLLCGELWLTIPYLAAIFIAVNAFWIYAVRGLGKMVVLDEEVSSSQSKSKSKTEEAIIYN